LSGFARIGDDSAGYGGVITASTMQQGAISGPLDLIYVRVGRAVLGFKLILQGEDRHHQSSCGACREGAAVAAQPRAANEVTNVRRRVG
jgi:hypothetical protein